MISLFKENLLIIFLFSIYLVHSINIDNLLVIGVDINIKQPKAYPLEIMNYHEIVNDVILGSHFAITWSPLTYSNVIVQMDSFLLYFCIKFDFY